MKRSAGATASGSTRGGNGAAAAPAPSAGAPLGEGPHTLEERLRTKLTPLVPKIAAEHNVEVHQVPGTGRNGRVTKEDILKYVETQKAAPAAQPSVTAPSAPTPPAQRPAAPVSTRSPGTKNGRPPGAASRFRIALVRPRIARTESAKDIFLTQSQQSQQSRVFSCMRANSAIHPLFTERQCGTKIGLLVEASLC